MARKVPDSLFSFLEGSFFTDEASGCVLVAHYPVLSSLPEGRSFHIASPLPGIAERLARLLSLPRMRLVIISSRPAREIHDQLLLPVEVLGCYGMEQVVPHRSSIKPPPLSAEVETLLRKACEWMQRHLRDCGLPPVLCSLSTGCLTLQWHTLPAETQRQLRETATHTFTSMVEPLSVDRERPLMLIPFKGGLELRAKAACIAEVVRCLRQMSERSRSFIFLGCDTDNAAFAQAAKAFRGLSVLVRSPPCESEAHAWLTPGNEVLAFLDLVAKVWDRPEQATPDVIQSQPEHCGDTVFSTCKKEETCF
jgi:hypothetical protein